MATTSKIQATEGSGKNIATYSISEDAVTKDIQRVVQSDNAGVEKGTGANPQTVDTELASTAVLADATSNPNITQIQAFPMVFNGTNWDRIPGDMTVGQFVSIASVAGALADASSNSAHVAADQGHSPVNVPVYNYIFNGTAWDRLRGDTTNGAWVNIKNITVPAATTMQTAATANGNGTNLNVQGYATAIINITSSPAMSGGTIINFEASTDDTEWQPILAHQIGLQGNQILTTSTDGDYRLNAAGFKSVRARISGYSAGTVSVKGYASPLAGVASTVGIAGTVATNADISNGGGAPSKGLMVTGWDGSASRFINTDSSGKLISSPTTNKQAYGSYTAMTVTNLQSLASSATVGWQSARIDNQTSIQALDYEIFIKLTTANTAPGSDKLAYVYISPAITTDGGTTWLHTDQGTGTLPTGIEGAATIASPNNLIPLGALSYTTQQMVMQKSFLLSNAVGQLMPSGFSIIIINFTGAALSTACVVAYRPLNLIK